MGDFCSHTDGRFGFGPSVVRSNSQRRQGAAELADLLRLFHEPAPQRARADHAGERQELGAAVGLPGAIA